MHRFLISGPNLRIDASKPSRTAQRLHRFLISGSHLGIDAAPSLLHRRMARLSPPYQRSASESNLLCGKVEWFRLQQSSRQRRIARLQQSSRQRRIARLQQSRWVQAGTGCHEGGIILSKKPPEWRLSPPYQRSASEANLRCVNEGSLCRPENDGTKKTTVGRKRR